MSALYLAVFCLVSGGVFGGGEYSQALDVLEQLAEELLVLCVASGEQAAGIGVGVHHVEHAVYHGRTDGDILIVGGGIGSGLAAYTFHHECHEVLFLGCHGV